MGLKDPGLDLIACISFIKNCITGYNVWNLNNKNDGTNKKP